MGPACTSPGRPSWGPALQSFLFGGVRGPAWDSLGAAAPFVVVAICGATYGAVMASYGGVLDGRYWLVLASTAKVPILFGCTLFIALPGFYVANLLCGVGDDFARVWRGLVDFQLSVALQLVALAPVTAFLNLATGSYAVAQGWSILVFAGVAWQAQGSLSACYRELLHRNPIHAWLRWLWLVLYGFVGIQMAWILRPFVGHPDKPPQLFRDDFGNAYVQVGEIILRRLGELF